MKHIKTMLRMFTVLGLLACLAIPALAADDLNIYPDETTGGEMTELKAATVYARIGTDPVPTYTTSQNGIDFIISFEGFSAKKVWDSSRYSIGYGNSYDAAVEMFGSELGDCDECEDCTITEEQAMLLFQSELAEVEDFMNDFYCDNGIVLNQNQFDALISFTYNVGISWTTYKNDDGTWCKLKVMLLDDPSTWTEERAQECFGTWVYADGVKLEGLVKRRAAEATLFCTPCQEQEEEPENAVFSDVSEDAWYYDEVMAVYELGLMEGMGDGTFRPENGLTRAQLVKILANFDEQPELSDEVDSGFTDVASGSWYAGEVAWAAEMGYVNGYDDGTFRPDVFITREQLCTIIARYLQSKGLTVEPEAGVFADDGEISDYARDAVYYCAALGLVEGVGDNRFSPKTGATRAQAAAVILRMFELG